MLSLFGGVLLSVIFCALSFGRMRRNNTGGRGLAIAGLIISGLWVLLIVIGITLAAVLDTPDATRNAGGQVTTPGTVDINDVRVHDCLQDFKEGILFSIKVVPCSGDNAAEALTSFDLPDGSYPGDDSLTVSAEQGCADRVSQSALEKIDSSDQYGLTFLYPKRSNWSQGDRSVVCLVTAQTGRLTGNFEAAA